MATGFVPLALKVNSLRSRIKNSIKCYICWKYLLDIPNIWRSIPRDLPASFEISPWISINFISEVPSVLWAKWFHITSRIIENKYVFVLGDLGHHSEAKKSDCVADNTALQLEHLNSAHVKSKRSIQIVINKLSQHTANWMITFFCYDSKFPRSTLSSQSSILWTWSTCIWSHIWHKNI
jgi:hypothetical protein